MDAVTARVQDIGSSPALAPPAAQPAPGIASSAPAGRRAATWRAAFRLLRPRQWIKNSFVLAPLIFSRSFTHPRAVVEAALAAVLFCVASSAGYIINDLADREADALHPIKSHTRPLAAGQIGIAQARTVLVALLIMIAAAFAWSPATAAVAVAYLALSAAYTAKLKHLAVWDIFALAFGFVLRALCGAVAIAVPLSPWMLITTLCLALYLATVKRRAELVAATPTRAVLRSYTLPLLDRYAEMAAVCAVVFYGLFVATVRPALAITIPLVLFGIFRYWYVAESTDRGESPSDALWADAPLFLVVVAWVVLCAAMLLRGR